jgi:preprotein translocase subunit YajC
MNNAWILAQAADEEAPTVIPSEPLSSEGQATTTVADSNTASGTTQAQRPSGYFNFILIGMMLVVMYLLLFRGPRKKQQEHKTMVQSLQKNDRVRTIGGIVGTVVDIKGEEVTLKVDESNNTKIKVIASAIGKNLSKDKEDG